MQGLRKNLVALITSQRAEPIDRNEICLMCVPGYAASRLRNPANLLPISRYAQDHDYPIPERLSRSDL